MGDINKNKLKELLLAMLETLDENTSDNTNTEHHIKPNTSNTTNNSRKKRYGGGENLFLQMPEADMHKQDVEIDKLLAPKQLTARNRPSTLVDVQCRICGKKEQTSSQLVPESISRYKCNECSKVTG